MSSLSGHVDFSAFEPLHSRVKNSDPIFFFFFVGVGAGIGIYYSSKCIHVYCVLNILYFFTHTQVLHIYTYILYMHIYIYLYERTINNQSHREETRAEKSV